MKTFSLINISSIDMSKLGINITDIIISGIVSVFILLVIARTIGFENLITNLNQEPSQQLLAVFSHYDLNNLKNGLDEKNINLLLSSSFIVIIAFVIIIYCLIHNRLTKIAESKNQQLTNKYQNYLSETIIERSTSKDDLLFHNNQSNKKQAHLSKEDFTNVNKRQIFLKELVGMYSLVSGTDKQKLKNLYFALGFIDDLDKKYKSPDWVDRAAAIKETEQFRVRKFYPYLARLSSDTNSTVRENAMLARIKVEEKPLVVIGEIQRQLSKWEKHNILLALKTLPSHRIPNFENLIGEFNHHKEFLAELKEHFHQSDTVPLQMLKVV